jgi:hypothetical protein
LRSGEWSNGLPKLMPRRLVSLSPDPDIAISVFGRVGDTVILEIQGDLGEFPGEPVTYSISSCRWTARAPSRRPGTLPHSPKAR